MILEFKKVILQNILRAAADLGALGVNHSRLHTHTHKNHSLLVQKI